MGSVPGSGGRPGEGSVHPLQDSCLENPMDRGAWRATVHVAAESDTPKSLAPSLHFSRGRDGHGKVAHSSQKEDDIFSLKNPRKMLK